VVLFNYMKFDLDGAIAAASTVSILMAISVVVLLEKMIGLKVYAKL
jgi:putative spermidine/putrescine transport system permease protein